jgi:hypothetical protein
MHLNYGAILLATILQFAAGAIWYSLLFSKQWGTIHGFDKLSKEIQQKLAKSMGPFYGIQAFITLVTTIILAIFITSQPTWNAYAMAGLFWLGFVVPTQISAAIFGSTERKFMFPKIAIQAGASIVCLEIAATVLHLWV